MDQPTVGLPNKGKTFQWGWQTEPLCLTPETEHEYVERKPHNNRGFNYSDCVHCGLTMYVDSSD